MSVDPLAWFALAVIVTGLLMVDFIGHARKPHPPSMHEAAGWTIGYICLAVAYGLAVWRSYGRTYAGQFYAGWLTEWSLSVDNLFVFILILSAFRVPRDFQQKALLLGIAAALVLRLAFILAGAALIQLFSWVFYLFGAFLVYTAIKQLLDARKDDDAEEDATAYVDNSATRFVRRLLPTTDGFVGNKLLHRHAGRTMITPLLIVVIALGTADLIEDLALLGALNGKLVYGSMNRGGLAGAAFEMDDRFTGYDARGVVDAGLDGGKMLLRVDYEDPRTVGTIASCAHAIDDLAGRRVMAMVEPFISRRVGGRIVNDLSADAIITSMAIASGLGRTSAYTWLKLPAVDDVERVMAASTLPTLILGGAVAEDPEAARASWARALALPTVRGLVIGRSLLFPPDDDVAGAVDNTVGLLS